MLLLGLLHCLPVPEGWSLQWLRNTFLGCADIGDNEWPSHGPQLVEEVFEQLNDISNIMGPCDACMHTLDAMKSALNKDRSILGALFYGICSDRASGALFEKFCTNSHFYSANATGSGFSFLPDFANALSELDPWGLDGQYMCHYIFANACPRPQTPVIDYSQYWPPPPRNSPPIARANRTLRVLHVSDIHLEANYTENTPANCLGYMCCDSHSFQDPIKVELPAPKYGHFQCDCPQALLESSLNDTIARSDYEFALFTGDMADHNPIFITQDEVFEEEIRIMRALKHYLGDVPVFPVLGNHDSYPFSQEPPSASKFAHRTELNIELMQHMWSKNDWIDDDAADQIQLTHGGYVVEPLPGLKVITLNSNYWYRWNFYNYVDMYDPDPSGTLQFLIDELLDCERRNIKAWVQAHVPPGGLPDEALPPGAAMLAATLERFANVITGQFFGHTHLDEFTVLYGNNATDRSEENALGVAWIAPSITPFTDLNPAWRYYEVDANTFEIMDAVTVYAEIEPLFGVPWELSPDLNWEVLYSTREKYGPVTGWPESEPLNGKFWHRVATEFLYDTDFTRSYVKRAFRQSSQAPDCSAYECRADRYCYSTSMTPDQVVRCHKIHHTGQRARGPSRKKKSHRRKYAQDGKLAQLRSGTAFHGIPQFPMPRPPRF